MVKIFLVSILPTYVVRMRAAYYLKEFRRATNKYPDGYG